MKNFNYYNRPKQDHINKKNHYYKQSDLLTTKKTNSNDRIKLPREQIRTLKEKAFENMKKMNDINCIRTTILPIT